jgi:hypothetical protein
MLKRNIIKVACRLILFTFVHSCGTRGSYIKSDDSTSAPNMEVTRDQVDSMSRAAFLTFRDKFKKNMNGRVDSTKLISLAYAKHLLADQIDTSINKKVTPVDLIVNRSGNYFIIKEHCAAGGDCASYFLLRFNSEGRFVRAEIIGNMAAEESTSIYFDYKVESDSSLIAYKIDYNEIADSAIDTVKRRIKLSIQ